MGGGGLPVRRRTLVVGAPRFAPAALLVSQSLGPLGGGLLLEDGGYLLLEDGSFLLLE